MKDRTVHLNRDNIFFEEKDKVIYRTEMHIGLRKKMNLMDNSLSSDTNYES